MPARVTASPRNPVRRPARHEAIASTETAEAQAITPSTALPWMLPHSTSTATSAIRRLRVCGPTISVSVTISSR